MDRVKDFVIDYIQKEYTIDKSVDILSLNYVESGYINSLGLIQFIATIEDEFGISFSDDELNSEDIQVVGKLIELINRKMQ